MFTSFWDIIFQQHNAVKAEYVPPTQAFIREYSKIQWLADINPYSCLAVQQTNSGSLSSETKKKKGLDF